MTSSATTPLSIHFDTSHYESPLRCLWTDTYTSVKATQRLARQLQHIESDPLQVHDAADDMADRAYQLSLDLESRYSMTQLAIRVTVYVLTGTTLQQAASQTYRLAVDLHGIENRRAAQLRYPKLWRDAIEAGETREAYVEVAKRYPSLVVTIATGHKPHSGLIKALHAQIHSNWMLLREHAIQGLTHRHPDFADLVDINMQLCEHLCQLAMSHELDLTYEQWLRQGRELSKEHTLALQSSQSYWSLCFIGHFYLWVRSCPRHLPGTQPGQQWIRSSADSDDFYDETSRAFAWRMSYNRMIDCVAKHVNIDTLLRIDERFYVQADTLESYRASQMAEKNDETFAQVPPLLKLIAQSKWIEDNYITTQCKMM